MKKKDFSQVNTEPLYNMITEATETQDTAEKPDTDGLVFEEAPGAAAAAEPYTPPEEPAEKPKRGPRTFHDGTSAEDKAALESLRTGGRKGLKLSRINMAFTPENYDYIKTMSIVSGQNLTEFVNKIIKQHREEHGDLYQQAVKFRNSL